MESWYKLIIICCFKSRTVKWRAVGEAWVTLSIMHYRNVKNTTKYWYNFLANCWVGAASITQTAKIYILITLINIRELVSGCKQEVLLTRQTGKFIIWMARVELKYSVTKYYYCLQRIICLCWFRGTVCY